MIKGLREARMTDVLPRVLTEEPWVRALSGAIGWLHEQTVEYAGRIRIYTDIGAMPEDVIDALAVDRKIDWYETDGSLAQKRATVASAAEVQRIMGTVRAVKLHLLAAYPDAQVQEWFEYGGEPGHFRIMVNSGGVSVDRETMNKILRSVETVKRASAWMDEITVERGLLEHHVHAGGAFGIISDAKGGDRCSTHTD